MVRGYGAVLLLLVAECKPPAQKMLVVYVHGDVFLPDFRSATWNSGDAVDCELASKTSIPIDKRGDLLLCGGLTQLAWSQTWLRADIKSQLYQSANTLAVDFSWHGSRRRADPASYVDLQKIVAAY